VFFQVYLFLWISQPLASKKMSSR